MSAKTIYMTPVPRWTFGAYTFSNGVSIVPRPDVDALRLTSFASLSQHEVDEIKRSVFWMAIECPRETPFPEKREKVRTLLNTVYSIQIVSPTGWSGVIAGLGENIDAQFDHLDQFLFCAPSKLATGLDQSDLNTISKIVDGVHEAFRRKIVRIQTPAQLLIQGQQTRQYYISLLLWTIALDALMAAASEEAFSARLTAFIGRDEYIFPEDKLGFQAEYKVGDVVKDIYVLRGILAHGNQIPEKFWKEDVGFKIADRRYGIRLDPWSDWSYAAVLAECSLFLLCATLRKILLKPSFMNIVGTSSWESYLESLIK